VNKSTYVCDNKCIHVPLYKKDYAHGEARFFFGGGGVYSTDSASVYRIRKEICVAGN